MREEALQIHRMHQGKLSSKSKVAVKNMKDLSLVYSPGVAEPCKEIQQNKEHLYQYTMKANTVAVVTDGTAVLGLGNIGADAALPVMEGKAILFKHFAGVDAVPLCIDTANAEKVIETVKLVQSSYGGINLEDIKAPNCFIIEKHLKQALDIPVFHDDQHGTAIVTTAALINALKITGKDFSTIKIVINGAGAAGIAITKMLLDFKVQHMLVCDTKGIIYQDRGDGMNAIKDEIASITNPAQKAGTLEDAIVDADVFIGVSVEGALTKAMVQKMKHDPIVFALANPNPEIHPNEAKKAGARIIGTGRSDFSNQINNVLAFPGIFRGALDVRATDINKEMKIAAAKAIASLVNTYEMKEDYIIPSPFDARVAPEVAAAVASAAMETGIARQVIDLNQLRNNCYQLSSVKITLANAVI
ncbi:malate dehydrogenase (oxaloacetate-decarboxylating) [Bacillus chungangensis]|uniref:Malate dehydrogenase (Oxaloacetate-decarboxylating) n=2 Tax=Bacillus chungangensis TaxID=587633 RepID=A0ABT9WT94_9BACI|nr:malate dehydrogenase (oxaloacetate-decarboxylating) [Bacillus chungangensis]